MSRQTPRSESEFISNPVADNVEHDVERKRARLSRPPWSFGCQLMEPDPKCSRVESSCHECVVRGEGGKFVDGKYWCRANDRPITVSVKFGQVWSTELRNIARRRGVSRDSQFLVWAQLIYADDRQPVPFRQEDQPIRQFDGHLKLMLTKHRKVRSLDHVSIAESICLFNSQSDYTGGCSSAGEEDYRQRMGHSVKEFLEFTDEEATNSLSFEFRYKTNITSKGHTRKLPKTDVRKTVQQREFIWNIRLEVHTGEPGSTQVSMPADSHTLTADSHTFQLYSKPNTSKTKPNIPKTFLKLKKVTSTLRIRCCGTRSRGGKSAVVFGMVLITVPSPIEMTQNPTQNLILNNNQ